MGAINSMVITLALKAQIEADIKLYKSHTERNGNEQLYLDLVARYSVIDSKFKNKLSAICEIFNLIIFVIKEYKFI